jgi:2-polyprenyl-3-methyl-5-hydroxy-6-metoxy-1,4-benzoquinol methylase
MKKKSESGYNERLFDNGIRRKLHLARFNWLSKSILRLNCQYQSVLELGCFDGKVIDYLPSEPTRYLGLDANWEGGLDMAKNKWKNKNNYTFRQCSTPENMEIGVEQYDISICMETLEHVPPQMVAPYLAEIAKVTKEYIFITVPNEIGVVLFFKHIVKRLFGDIDSYTASEFINGVLGNTDKVKRREHKGFNYNNLVAEVSDYFELIEVSGHPFGFAPASLNFGIGIIGKSKYKYNV